MTTPDARPRTFRVHMRGRFADPRGASAVEFALIVPLFFTLVLGMIYGGIAFDRKNQVIHASREGVRYGATLAIESSTGVPNAWFDRIVATTQGAANGLLDAAAPGQSLCIAYIGFAPTTTATQDWTRVRDARGSTVTYRNGSVTNPSSWCFDDGRGTDGKDRRVQVVGSMESDFFVFLFSHKVQLGSDAVARFEAVA